MKKTFFILMSLLIGSTVAFSADNILRENNRNHRGRFMRHHHPHFKRGQHAEKQTVPLHFQKKEITPLRKPIQQRYQYQRPQHRPHIYHRHGHSFHQQRVQPQLRRPLHNARHHHNKYRQLTATPSKQATHGQYRNQVRRHR